ncbi:hypothetical protein GCM10007919_07750 [Rhizobium indigoferae]|nr:hypothetical protein GCM10007919_07750 [Rhizobium indigoferae]
MHADTTHRLDAEIEGGRIAPAAVVDNQRDAFSRKVLRHRTLIPGFGELAGASDNRSKPGLRNIMKLQKFRAEPVI